VADVFVVANHDLALARLDRHRNDLVLETPGLLCGFRLVLRGGRERVLLVAGELPLPGDVLARVAHVIAVEGVPQPVADHRVAHRVVAQLHARPQLRATRGKRHRVLPTGHDDAGIAAGDLLHAHGDRAQARATDLVQPPG